jgi:hypothetical protein
MLAVSDSYEVASVVLPTPVSPPVSASENGPVDPPGPPVVVVLDDDELDDDELDDDVVLDDDDVLGDVVLVDDVLGDVVLVDDVLGDVVLDDDELGPLQPTLSPGSGPVDHPV